MGRRRTGNKMVPPPTMTSSSASCRSQDHSFKYSSTLPSSDEVVCCSHGRKCLIGRIEKEQQRLADEENDEPLTREDTISIASRSPVDDNGYENVPVRPQNFPSPPKPEPEYENLGSSFDFKAYPTQFRDVFDYTDFYLGVMSAKSAAHHCTTPTAFYIYHRLEHMSHIDDLPPALPLVIVYRASNGEHYHFTIVKQTIDDFSIYYVDYGDQSAPKFSNLCSLMRCYSVYAQLYDNMDGEVGVDVFPWWIVNGRRLRD